MPSAIFLLLFCAAASAAGAAGVDLTIQLPEKIDAKSAVAVNPDSKLQITGKVSDHSILFPQLLPDTPYDIAITLADGKVLQGVDMSWYNPDDAPEKDATPPGPLTAEDLSAIRDIITIPTAFENKKDLLIINGTHQRATVLVQLIRDSDFYNANGNIVWRIELWYFQYRHGGWERPRQTGKILRRERFANLKAFKDETEKFQYLPQLGGLRLPPPAKDKPQQTLKLDSTKTPDPPKAKPKPVETEDD
jgi:hypothetical protein